MWFVNNQFMNNKNINNRENNALEIKDVELENYKKDVERLKQNILLQLKGQKVRFAKVILKSIINSLDGVSSID